MILAVLRIFPCLPCLTCRLPCGLRRYNAAKWVPEPKQKFFIYTGGPFEYLHLLPCYKEKYKVRSAPFSEGAGGKG